jgi:hypothetical protein
LHLPDAIRNLYTKDHLPPGLQVINYETNHLLARSRTGRAFHDCLNTNRKMVIGGIVFRGVQKILCATAT